MHRPIPVFAGAAALFMLSGAHAAADLAIIDAKFVGSPLKGSCNRVAVTYGNLGNQNLIPGTKGAIITFPQLNPFTDRSERALAFAGGLSPNRNVTATIDKVTILTLGSVTVQIVADAANVANEGPQTQQNNTRTFNVTVAGECGGTATDGALTDACDLEMLYTAPAVTQVGAGQAVSYKVSAKNKGTTKCLGLNVQMHRYSGGSASGYGSAVGGTSGSIRAVNPLDPGATQELEWVDNVSAGTFTYQVKPMGTWNDGNNGNHRPTKTVVAN
jgi:hypothetical protein